jgi:SAM-dependent methyltransferase
MTKQAARNSSTGDIILVRDRETGLIFNAAFKPELLMYDGDYQNEQAFSRVFRDHLNEVAAVINLYFERETLIEVGCGKGYFLEHLIQKGFSVTGFDPTYEGCNPHVVKAYFEPGTTLSSDGIIMRHVLEHVRDPLAFLKSIRDANGGKGKIYIEVPCFDWIMKNNAWFDIFYEHVNYFRASDFLRIFGKVLDIGHVFNGQYLYVVADLATIQDPLLEANDDVSFPNNFLVSVDRYVKKIRKVRINQTSPIVVWGGASKGVIFALFMERRGVVIDFVIDINPAKQGKYIAGTGYVVSSPKEALSQISGNAVVFVMNANYLTEIQEMTSNKFEYIVVQDGKI